MRKDRIKEWASNLILASSIVTFSSSVWAESKSKSLFAELNDLFSKTTAKSDQRERQHNMGLLYYVGRDDTPVDYKQAVQWFSQAAAADYAPSQYVLSVMYLQGNGVKADAEKGVALLYRAAQQGHPEAVEFYHSLQVQAQKMNSPQTASKHTSTTAIKYYDPLKLEPNNFKKVILPNLQSETIARSFYTVTASRDKKMGDDWGNDKYYFINWEGQSQSDSNRVISITPSVTYQNLQKEQRYLVGVERAGVFGNGADTSHASMGDLELYLFKKLDDGQFQLVSKSFGDGMHGFYGYGTTWWDHRALQKNLQAFGENVMGTYTTDEHYGNGYSERFWIILLLNEDDYIMQGFIPEGAGSTDEPEYGYASMLKVIKSDTPFYSIDVDYQGTDMNDKNQIIKVNRNSRYEYNPHDEDYYTKYK